MYSVCVYECVYEVYILRACCDKPLKSVIRYLGYRKGLINENGEITSYEETMLRFNVCVE